jgi:hypothetical protein
LRSLGLLVVLVSVYFASWKITQTQGVKSTAAIQTELERDGQRTDASITPPQENSPMPFIVQRTVYGDFHATRITYLWLFGWRVRLPI